jgi:glycosyltransferase involved in cell wall biosynthesis
VSKAVLQLLSDPPLAARLGAAARRAIEQRHRAEGTVAQLSALYAAMIDSPEGVL